MSQDQQALFTYINAFVSEMIASGIRHVCISPGSRSTPLAMVLAEQNQCKLWLLIDERSAGFFALGLAKATGTPVALVCTSGSAAANYMPAVVEAHYGRVPLVLLTADRPHELRENGAPQAIDQIRLYGQHAKWFNDMAIPEDSPAIIRYARTIACRAVGTALAAPAGPVHINFPLREPLVPIRPNLLQEPEASAYYDSGVPTSDAQSGQPMLPVGAQDQSFPVSTEDAYKPAGKLPYVSLTHPIRRLDSRSLLSLARLMLSTPRGLIICGPQNNKELGEPVTRLAEALGYPVLADPLSQVRCGLGVDSVRLDAYDAFLRDDQFGENGPDFVLRLGAMHTSKPVLLYLQRHAGCEHIVVDPGDGWNEPTGLATQVLHADPVTFCQDLLAQVQGVEADSTLAVHQKSMSWLTLWQTANQVAQEAITHTVLGFDTFFEGRIFTELNRLLPAGTALFAGNSMPVRDLDTFFAAKHVPYTFFANRGTNGIDGVVSSALGAAAGFTRPTVLVIGDLSFYHDLGGLLAAKLHGIHLLVILVNNNGGGIFSFLPQANYPKHFEALFGTPIDLDFHLAVEMYGGRFTTVSNWTEFASSVTSAINQPGLSVVEVRTDRTNNVKQHREVWKAVSAGLRTVGL